jgi:hypothetical protein
MSLQMDFNPKFSPADWLLVQRKEFYKERNSRWKSQYDKSFWDDSRYGGGTDAQTLNPPALVDLLRMQRQGTLNPCHDGLPFEQGQGSSSSGAQKQAQRKSPKSQFSLPLASMPRAKSTPEVKASPDMANSTIKQGGSPLATVGSAMTQSLNRVERSTTRLEPVRTWQGDPEPFPAMRHADSDSLLAKVYTAKASMSQGPGKDWRDSMVIKQRPNSGADRFTGCKRSCAFSAGSFVPTKG